MLSADNTTIARCWACEAQPRHCGTRHSLPLSVCDVALTRGPAAHDSVPNRIRGSTIKLPGAIALGEALRNQSTVATLQFERAAVAAEVRTHQTTVSGTPG